MNRRIHRLTHLHIADKDNKNSPQSDTVGSRRVRSKDGYRKIAMSVDEAPNSQACNRLLTKCKLRKYG
jgi:hypothetical protein